MAELVQHPTTDDKIEGYIREYLLKSTIDLLASTSLDELLLIFWKHYLLFYITSYLNEEVNRTEDFPFS